MEGSQYKIITSALARFKEIESIYVFSNYVKAEKVVNCNIVCNIESVTENEELYRGIIANLELIRTLFERTNVVLHYTITTIDQFKEDMEDIESETYQNYCKSNVIYTKQSEKTR